jgi:biopolymer transport protein ExbD
MQRIRRVREQPTLDLAPLIDVIFLLLTFFVFSLAMAVQLRITEVRLPTGGLGDPVADQKSTLVALLADGSTTIDGQPVTLDALPDALTRALQDTPDLVVYVAADESAPARDLFALMDAFASARISNLRFLRAPATPSAASPAAPSSEPAAP